MSNEPAFEGVKPPDVIAFLVRDARRNVMGYCWRLWWGRTSFYMKPRYAPLAGLKVSMHGPDSRHGLPGFKVDFDRTALPGARLAGGLAVAHSDTLPAWFPGRPLANGRAIHVARIRHPWVMFHRGVPSAPTPTVPKGDAVALVVRPPEQMYAVDIDIYVCAREPFWPNETKARLDDAAFGPLRNAAGQYLTAVAHHRSVLCSPSPEGLIRGYPEGADDLVRGLGLRVDQGVLWICELLLSKAQMITAAKDLGSN
jgi:hypothetical protein